MAQTSIADPPKSKLIAYVQLMRLPNVFTAIADVMMGYLLTHDPDQGVSAIVVAVPLLLASALMYTAGMVLNDVFDVEVDRAERPERPLPSGQIPVARARWIGFELLLFGAFAGASISVWLHDPCPAAVSIALAALILLYDGVLKHTPLGPLAMGGCRFLNVLLGMSAAQQWMTVNYLVAGGVGVYIVGVTWFARGEAEPTSRRTQLFLAMLVMIAGMGMLAYFPDTLPVGAEFEPHQPLMIELRNWHLCWILLTLLTSWRCLRCVIQPHGVFVREAIRQCLVSLIIFDAAVTLSVRGIHWGIAVVLLIVPMTILGRWSYST